MTQDERRRWLIDRLLEERRWTKDVKVPEDAEGQWRLLRALFNIRMPIPVTDEFLKVQDAYLAEEIRRRGITDASALTPVRQNICLWKGDITTLKCGAIVNAANSQMLGCFYPNHGCIDNAIHTFAGVQLRLYCADLMGRQGHDEEPGGAKITPAFNLPADHVIHTVGPIVQGRLTEKEEQDLESCYRACLEMAEKNYVGSLAFCCISTGEFAFPRERAAQIAVRTVEAYMRESGSSLQIIFNVFQEADYEIYRKILVG